LNVELFMAFLQWVNDGERLVVLALWGEGLRQTASGWREW
jgi:hypothetical protein